MTGGKNNFLLLVISIIINTMFSSSSPFSSSPSSSSSSSSSSSRGCFVKGARAGAHWLEDHRCGDVQIEVFTPLPSPPRLARLSVRFIFIVISFLIHNVTFSDLWVQSCNNQNVKFYKVAIVTRWSPRSCDCRPLSMRGDYPKSLATHHCHHCKDVTPYPG